MVAEILNFDGVCTATANSAQKKGHSRVSAKKQPEQSRSSATYNLSPLRSSSHKTFRSSRHKTFRSSRHKTFRSSRHKTFRSSRQDLSFIKVPPRLHAYNAPLASRARSLHVVTLTTRSQIPVLPRRNAYIDPPHAHASILRHRHTCGAHPELYTSILPYLHAC